jgi:hypothetical protein
MLVKQHSRREAIELDQAWRSALGTSPHYRVRFEQVQLATWRERARAGVLYLQTQDTVAGVITFEPDEAIPHPADVWRSLRGDSAWFLGTELGWAVYGDHEEWWLVERADLERAGDDTDDMVDVAEH